MELEHTFFCPDDLFSTRQYFVEKITGKGGEYFADLPNLDSGYTVLITSDAVHQIKMIWKNGAIAILQLGSGTIRQSDNVMCPEFVHVISEEP